MKRRPLQVDEIHGRDLERMDDFNAIYMEERKCS